MTILITVPGARDHRTRVNAPFPAPRRQRRRQHYGWFSGSAEGNSVSATGMAA